jgi:hypothetical protein
MLQNLDFMMYYSNCLLYETTNQNIITKNRICKTIPKPHEQLPVKS